jgi:hypothetical protein
VLERTEGETSNFWKLRPTITLRYQRELYMPQGFVGRTCDLGYMVNIAQRYIPVHMHK